MPLDPEFIADCPYAPEGVFIDEMLSCDREASRVVCRMPTHAALPITNTQRQHEVRHPAHVAGGLLLHVTGIVGFAHGYYCLDLRHADGWVGYGVKADNLRFKELARIGEPIEIACQATRVRRGARRIVAIYDMSMTQGGIDVYSATQTAMFLKVA